MASFFRAHFSRQSASQGSNGNKTAAGPGLQASATGAGKAGPRRQQDTGSVHSNEPLVRNQRRPAGTVDQEGKLSKREKLKRHWKRFWVFWVLGIIIFLAIFLPVFFLVIIPAIIQRMINDASLPINGGTLALHSPNELKVSIKTTVKMPAGIKASLDPISLQLYNPNTATTTAFSPFMAVDLPKQHLDGPSEIDAPESIVRISNKTELSDWLRTVVRNPSSDLALRGDSHISLGAIRSPVHLQKTTTIRALNQLRGFGVPSIRLLAPPEADGTNLRGQLLFPNHTPLRLGLGNLTWNLWAGPVMLGRVHMRNVVASPGDNLLAFHGVLLLHHLLPNIGPILSSQASALARGNIRLGVSGNATVVNGEHVAFFEEVINKERFETELPVVSVLAQVLGGLLVPSSDNSTSALLDVMSRVFANKTLMDGIADKLNASRVVDRLNSTAHGAAVIPGSLLRRVQRELARTAIKAVVRDFKSARSKALWHPTH